MKKQKKRRSDHMPKSGDKKFRAARILEPFWDEEMSLPDQPAIAPDSEGRETSNHSSLLIESIRNEGSAVMNRREGPQAPRHPWAVDSLSRLLYYLGLQVWVLLALQAASVYVIARWARDQYDVSIITVFAALLGILWIGDCIFYFCLRGRIYPKFVKPGLIFLVATVLPGILIGLATYVLGLAGGSLDR
jgi:hypothetical protein